MLSTIRTEAGVQKKQQYRHYTRCLIIRNEIYLEDKFLDKIRAISITSSILHGLCTEIVTRGFNMNKSQFVYQKTRRY